jgi:hypothetical protein
VTPKEACRNHGTHAAAGEDKEIAAFWNLIQSLWDSSNVRMAPVPDSICHRQHCRAAYDQKPHGLGQALAQIFSYPLSSISGSMNLKVGD